MSLARAKFSLTGPVATSEERGGGWGAASYLGSRVVCTGHVQPNWPSCYFREAFKLGQTAWGWGTATPFVYLHQRGRAQQVKEAEGLIAGWGDQSRQTAGEPHPIFRDGRSSLWWASPPVVPDPSLLRPLRLPAVSYPHLQQSGGAPVLCGFLLESSNSHRSSENGATLRTLCDYPHSSRFRFAENLTRNTHFPPPLLVHNGGLPFHDPDMLHGPDKPSWPRQTFPRYHTNHTNRPFFLSLPYKPPGLVSKCSSRTEHRGLLEVIYRRQCRAHFCDFHLQCSPVDRK